MSRVLAAFLGGAVVASAAGYYNLHQDIFRATSDINKAILKLREDVAYQNRDLAAKVRSLEKELQTLRQQQGKPTDSDHNQ